MTDSSSSSCCKKKPNHCIACTVEQCKHHSETQNFCSLDVIQVGTHEKNPTVPACTDCQSFECKTTYTEPTIS